MEYFTRTRKYYDKILNGETLLPSSECAIRNDCQIDNRYFKTDLSRSPEYSSGNPSVPFTRPSENTLPFPIMTPPTSEKEKIKFYAFTEEEEEICRQGELRWTAMQEGRKPWDFSNKEVVSKLLFLLKNIDEALSDTTSIYLEKRAKKVKALRDEKKKFIGDPNKKDMPLEIEDKIEEAEEKLQGTIGRILDEDRFISRQKELMNNIPISPPQEIQNTMSSIQDKLAELKERVKDINKELGKSLKHERIIKE